MIQGVVGLLEDKYMEQIEQLWRMFRARFGIQGSNQTPYPHVSFHVAESYNTKSLDNLLAEFTSAHPPLLLRTSGIGIFPVPRPVLYLPIVRHDTLSSAHKRLWNLADQHAKGSNVHYEPDRWLPHITLAHGDMGRNEATDIIRSLMERPFNWDITCNELAIITDPGDGMPHRLFKRYPLRGKKSLPQDSAI